MEMVATSRLTPTVFETGIKLAIWTMVMPAFSISLAIVAPQRVQVPQVEVRIAARIPFFFSCSAISLPIRAASACVVPVPTVEKK